MAYYNYSNYPELKDTFVFGSVRGNIYSLAIDSHQKLEREIKIGFGFYPFVPVVAVTVSPTGQLYFAGYDIYRLDAIDPGEKQLMYPVEINASHIKVTGIDFEEKKKMALKLENEVGGKISLKIPNSMLGEIDPNLSTFEVVANDSSHQLADLPHKVSSLSVDDFQIVRLEVPSGTPKMLIWNLLPRASS